MKKSTTERYNELCEPTDTQKKSEGFWPYTVSWQNGQGTPRDLPEPQKKEGEDVKN